MQIFSRLLGKEFVFAWRKHSKSLTYLRTYYNFLKFGNIWRRIPQPYLWRYHLQKYIGGSSTLSMAINKEDQKSRYPWAFDTCSTDPYGLDIATKITHLLFDKKIDLHEAHRDYCGIGFKRGENNEIIIIGKVYDGIQIIPIKSWKLTEREDFLRWLAGQSDYSLSGHDSSDQNPFYEPELFERGNQRITKAILLNYIKRYRL